MSIYSICPTLVGSLYYVLRFDALLIWVDIIFLVWSSLYNPNSDNSIVEFRSLLCIKRAIRMLILWRNLWSRFQLIMHVPTSFNIFFCTCYLCWNLCKDGHRYFRVHVLHPWRRWVIVLWETKTWCPVSTSFYASSLLTRFEIFWIPYRSHSCDMYPWLHF